MHERRGKEKSVDGEKQHSCHSFYESLHYINPRVSISLFLKCIEF